ncbi:MAG TPA: DUF4126 domain-containing protein [Thermomicrobiales bacterium]|jgi:hypothetical protein|nr:DUF4126 domain-containing protein [Chloroflexota bacterium]HQX62750.1 DUF4126 domain-containing protein [Thermomicrobiales bacterium]HBY45411.1 DUF4126 domain-containing protein [Chloroflexota bacterium]HCG29664.1 DUF4126 domain-containing protein [Chloroflexota bacterium]HQZ89727.1 DUF4126 domain-containing protein [Thermomicrobiales bacterium]
MFELLTGLGLAMPAGLNAYIPILAIALADRYTGLIQLAAPYNVIASPWAIAIISVLLGIEIIADKIPIVDHINDLFQSFIRPAAGALLVMASTDAVHRINPILAMILGLFVAGGVHITKSTFRPIVTATTGGVGNPIVSAAEDGTAICLSVLALVAPILIVLVIVAVAGFAFVMIRRRYARRASLI